ncbi:MAG: hypothetical protein RR531_12325 [Longicatena sp.]
MISLKNTAFFYFLKGIVELRILDRSLERKTTISLERAYGSLSYHDREEYGQILQKLYSSEYCEFYKLRNTFLSSEKMFYILKPLTLDDAIELINAIMDDYDVSDDEELTEAFKNQLVDKISDHVQYELSDELAEAVYHVIDKAESEDIVGLINETSTFLEDAVWSELEDLACEKIKNHINNINGTIEIGDRDFDVSDMRYYLDISGSITSALKEDYDKDDDRRYSHSESGTSIIVAMFER